MMKHSKFSAAFLTQIRYWSFHCILNALPSFWIALKFLQLWKQPSSVVAMICAIITFIFLYAAVTSFSEPLSDRQHLFSRALRLGAKFRAWISAGSLVALLFGKDVMVMLPDMWCGFLAAALVNQAFGGNTPASSFSFLQVYSTTMVEGFILSFLLLLISFFAVIFLQARDRRNAFSSIKSVAATGV